MLRRMPRERGAVPNTLLYAAGLAGICSLAWLGYMAATMPDVRAQGSLATGPAGMIWFVPAVYLAAWQVLVFRTLSVAIAGAVLLTVLSFATFLFAWIAGLFSLGLLVPPASVIGMSVMVVALAAIQRRDADTPTNAVSDRAHGLGAGLSVVVFLVSMPVTLGKSGVPPLSVMPSWQGIAALIGGLLCAFAPHAALTWASFRKVGWPTIRPARVAGLLVLAWLLPALALAVETRSPAALAWPVQTVALTAARKADKDLFSSIRVQQPGFHAGEKLTVQLGRRDITATIPPGWLGLRPRYPGRSEHWRAGLWLAPDPRVERQPPSPTTRINIGTQPSRKVARPADARASLKHPRSWREFGCATDNPSVQGLVVCRQIAFEAGDRRHEPLIARFPETALQHRLLLDRNHKTQAYFLFGPSVEAECEMERECKFWFPVGEGDAIWVTMPEAEVHRWREAKAEADAVARAAIGFGLASRPTIEQPDGEVLPLASP